jgi:hypothetical protein
MGVDFSCLYRHFWAMKDLGRCAGKTGAWYAWGVPKLPST